MVYLGWDRKMNVAQTPYRKIGIADDGWRVRIIEVEQTLPLLPVTVSASREGGVVRGSRKKGANDELSTTQPRWRVPLTISLV